jgi:hypothetical protein
MKLPPRPRRRTVGVICALVIVVCLTSVAAVGFLRSNAEPKDSDSVAVVQAAFERLAERPFSVRTAFTSDITGEGTTPPADATFATGDVDLRTHHSTLTEAASSDMAAARVPQAVVVDDVAFMFVGVDATGAPILVSSDRADRAGLVAVLPPMAVLQDLPSWVSEAAVPGKYLGQRKGVSHWSVKLDSAAMEELTSRLVSQISNDNERAAATLALQNNELRYVPSGEVHVWVDKSGNVKRVAVELTLGEGTPSGESTGALSWYITGTPDKVTAKKPAGDHVGIAEALKKIEDAAAALNPAGPTDPAKPAGPGQ